MITKEQIEIALSDSEGRDKLLPSDFFYHKIILPKYEFFLEYGEYGIIRTPYDVYSIGDLSIRNRAQNSNLLVSLLKLRTDLPDKCFENLQALYTHIFGFDFEKNSMVTEKIIKWCKTNGYPFPIEEEKRRTGRKVKPLFKIKIQTYLSFKVADFILQLNDIVNYFILYNLIVFGENKINQPLYFLPTMLEQTAVNSPPMQVINPKDCKGQEQKLFRLFEEKYQSTKFTSRLVSEPDLHFEVETDNLFDAAFYELSLLLPVKGKVLRQCPKCGKSFSPKDPRQKYCGKPCTRQAAYKRREAAKKKTAGL